jgi:AraC-like DNA-binding protein
MWTDLITYTPMYVTAFWALTLLSTAGTKNPPKQILAVFMVLAFFLYFSHALFFQEQFSTYLIFDPVYMFCALSVYPMYYWYIRMLTVDSSINLRWLWLFLPALILSLLYTLVYLLMSPEDRMNFLLSGVFKTGHQKPSGVLFVIQKAVYLSSRVVFVLQIFVFVALGRRLVLRYNTRVENFYASYEKKTIRWVTLLLYSFLVTSLMSTTFNLIGRSFFLENRFLVIPSAIFSILLFLIGLQGHLQEYSFVDLVNDEQEPAAITMKEYNYGQLKERLLDLFEKQEIFRKQDLKITQISALLQTNRTYVSTLINSEFGYTFSDFVNNYRVAAARKILSDAKQQNYSLNYVSEACGFGSVNSFIRIFREKEGITPGKYRDKIFLKLRNESL